MLVLQGATDLLGMLSLRQILDQTDKSHFIDIIESSGPEDVAQHYFFSFKARDAFLHRRIDDFRMLRHVFRSSRRSLPCSLSYLLNLFIAVVAWHGALSSFEL